MPAFEVVGLWKGGKKQHLAITPASGEDLAGTLCGIKQERVGARYQLKRSLGWTMENLPETACCTRCWRRAHGERTYKAIATDLVDAWRRFMGDDETTDEECGQGQDDCVALIRELAERAGLTFEEAR